MQFLDKQKLWYYPDVDDFGIKTFQNNTKLQCSCETMQSGFFSLFLVSVVCPPVRPVGLRCFSAEAVMCSRQDGIFLITQSNQFIY